MKLPYVKQGDDTAVITGDNILVPDLALVLKATPQEGVWDNGLFRAHIQENKQVKKRNLTTGEDNLDALRKEMNSRLQYILEVVKSPRSKLEYLCDVFHENMQIERISAVENTARYARIKLGQTKITARVAGDFLIVYPCLPIAQWRWQERPRRGNACGRSL